MVGDPSNDVLDDASDDAAVKADSNPVGPKDAGDVSSCLSTTESHGIDPAIISVKTVDTKQSIESDKPCIEAYQTFFIYFYLN